MIEKIKTIRYKVRSHGHKTTLYDNGDLIDAIDLEESLRAGYFKKARVKKMIGHLQDVLKCMKQIEKEKTKKKMENSQDDISKP